MLPHLLIYSTSERSKGARHAKCDDNTLWSLSCLQKLKKSNINHKVTFNEVTETNLTVSSLPYYRITSMQCDTRDYSILSH